jgi:hypothetical protein
VPSRCANPPRDRQRRIIEPGRNIGRARFEALADSPECHDFAGFLAWSCRNRLVQVEKLKISAQASAFPDSAKFAIRRARFSLTHPARETLKDGDDRMGTDTLQTPAHSLATSNSSSPAREITLHGQDPYWSGAWVAWATMGFVALGIWLRVARYLLNFPLWCDETMLAANFLDKSYSDLLFHTLDYRQIGPILFLLIELTSVKVLGFSELSLRLFPALCGIASVPLFRHVAGRVLGGVPLLMAVAVFAVSGWPLRYVAEVKPYASDLFVALGLLALAIEWKRAPERIGWLWGLAVAGPIAVALSLPAVFTVGGVGVALAIPVWKTRRIDARAALATFGLISALTFLAFLRFYKTAPQDNDYFHNAWANAFPPLMKPIPLALWLLDVHTGYMFAYPDGGERGASTVTFLGILAAVVVFWKRGDRNILGLMLAPFAFALAAAAVHRYPYGVSARTTQYAAPAICLLAGLGFAAFLASIRRDRFRNRALASVAIVLALVGFLRLGLDLSRPYKTATDERDRSFARWFWTELSRQGELACVKRDFGAEFDPRHWSRDATDTYLCYQKIFSPRHRAGGKLDESKITEKHPLRCVLFNEIPAGTPAFDSWMAGMLAKYDLRGVTPYPVSSIEKKMGATWDQLYLVYEFVPKAQPTPSIAARPGAELKR